jgi:hypothetical protein
VLQPDPMASMIDSEIADQAIKMSS